MDKDKVCEVARRIVEDDNGLLLEMFQQAIDYLPGIPEVADMDRVLKDLEVAVKGEPEGSSEPESDRGRTGAWGPGDSG